MTVKNLPPIDEQRLRDMRAMGLTAKEIADEFGISVHKIRHLCEVIGIPSPNSKGGATDWAVNARRSSWRLGRALAKAHPDKCGGVAG